MDFKPTIKWLIIFILMPLSFIASADTIVSDQESSQIQLTLQQMAIAWNKGNLQAFMHGYENSSSTIYISNAGIVKGYQAIADRYIKHYPNRASMGELSTRTVDFISLSSTDVMVVGSWHINRIVNHHFDDIGGVFSLIFRNNSQGWHIIVDHTC